MLFKGTHTCKYVIIVCVRYVLMLCGYLGCLHTSVHGTGACTVQMSVHERVPAVLCMNTGTVLV